MRLFGGDPSHESGWAAGPRPTAPAAILPYTELIRQADYSPRCIFSATLVGAAFAVSPRAAPCRTTGIAPGYPLSIPVRGRDLNFRLVTAGTTSSDHPT